MCLYQTKKEETPTKKYLSPPKKDPPLPQKNIPLPNILPSKKSPAKKRLQSFWLEQDLRT